MQKKELLLECMAQEHSRNTAQLAMAFGEKLGLDSQDVSKLFTSGMYHDIGKLLIPQEIIEKPGPLNDKERKHMQKHVLYGAKVLKDYGYGKDIISAVLYHHEGWDGSGYPERLKQYKIPLFARILHICDSYDAMTSKRPYRKYPYTSEEALYLLYTDSRTDRGLLDIFVKVLDLELFSTPPPNTCSYATQKYPRFKRSNNYLYA